MLSHLGLCYLLLHAACALFELAFLLHPQSARRRALLGPLPPAGTSVSAS